MKTHFVRCPVPPSPQLIVEEDPKQRDEVNYGGGHPELLCRPRARLCFLKVVGMMFVVMVVMVEMVEMVEIRACCRQPKCILGFASSIFQCLF